MLSEPEDCESFLLFRSESGRCASTVAGVCAGNVVEVVEHLHGRECRGRVVIDDACKSAIDAYYELYGAREGK